MHKGRLSMFMGAVLRIAAMLFTPVTMCVDVLRHYAVAYRDADYRVSKRKFDAELAYHADLKPDGCEKVGVGLARESHGFRQISAANDYEGFGRTPAWA